MDVEEIMLRITAFALGIAFAGAAAGQAARPDPADPKALVPAPRYESTFKDYRPHAEPEIARWRETNEEMGRLGGHAGHLPRAAGQQKPAPKAPAHSGHGGHR
jgi:hypothetical protein